MEKIYGDNRGQEQKIKATIYRENNGDKQSLWSMATKKMVIDRHWCWQTAVKRDSIKWRWLMNMIINDGEWRQQKYDYDGQCWGMSLAHNGVAWWQQAMNDPSDKQCDEQWQ